MPLRAVFGTNTILSFQINDKEWKNLKNSPERKKLVMPCCGERAIPKSSPLGTKFFSHHRNCTSPPESKEHLFLKSIIAKSAMEAGWNTTTEYPGTSKDGESWVADVYCTKGNAQVALEVQLTKQDISEFKRRQNRYKRSGVRCAWFIPERHLLSLRNSPRKSLPIFGIKNHSGATPSPESSDFSVMVEKLIQDLLSGKIQFQDDPEETDIHYFYDQCRRCKKTNKLPCGWSCEIFGENIKSMHNCSTVLREILRTVGNRNLRSRGINEIASHPNLRGNAPGFPYCATCIHCGLPLANSYLYKKLERRNGGEINIAFESFVTGRCNGRWDYIESKD
jgi:hypothetical protein